MSIDAAEKQEREPAVETARGAIFYRGKFLLLEKDATSKNPAAFEFPGGTVEKVEGTELTEEGWLETLIRELKEETGIDVRDFHPKKIDDFRYYFETGEENKKGHWRHARLFLIQIPDSENISISVGMTKNEIGASEDHHAGHKWVTPRELVELATTLQENPITTKPVRLLGRNSRHIKKLLEAIAG